MTDLPLRPHLKNYRGGKAELRDRNAEFNRRMHMIAEYANKLIANDPSENQMLHFALIAADLGVSADDVRFALSNGGYNGLTIMVRPNDRIALEHYKTK